MTDIFKYLICKKPEQRTAVQKQNIKSLPDLFEAVMSSSQKTAHSKALPVVSKARLVNFVNAHCEKAFIDFQLMKRTNVIEVSGKYPNQTVKLCSNLFVTPRATNSNFALNDFLSEEKALAKAIQNSLSCMNTMHTEPRDLCCPMTGKLFEDPVDTIHGMTYERHAVTAWLKTNNTDPTTNDYLLVTTVWSNESMKQRVAEFVEQRSCL